MNMLIFLSFIAAVIGVGLFFYRRERNHQKAERERKLKLAEGQAVDDPPKKKRKRKWWPAKQTTKLSLLASDQQQLKTRVPPYIDKLMQAYHAHLQTLAACQAAGQDYNTCVENERAILPARTERVRFRSWLFGCVSASKASFKAAREYTSRCAEFEARLKEFVALKAPLQDFIKGLNTCDLSDIDLEEQRALDIATAALAECKERELPSHPQVASFLPEPDAADEQVQAIIDDIADKTEALFATINELSVAQGQSARLYRRLDEIKNKPELTEPQKPNDQEVQTYLSAALEWAGSVQQQAQEGRQTLPAINEAAAACTKAIADLRQQQTLLIQAKGAWKAKKLQSTWKSLSPRRLDKSEEEKTPAAPGSAPPARPTNKTMASSNEEAKLATAGQNDAEQVPAPIQPICPWWQRGAAVDKNVDAGSKTSAQKECEFLTDEQAGTDFVATRVASQVESLVSGAVSQTGSWGGQSPPLLHEGQLSQTDADTVKWLRAAMRTLGFAIAQSNAAGTKLEGAKQEPERKVDAVEPTLNEANVESYIRLHRKWTEDRERVNKHAAERQARLTALEQQRSERKQQVPEAAVVLAGLLKTYDASNREFAQPLPGELDRTVRAARLLAKLYVPPPPPPPPPKKKEESSSSSSYNRHRRSGWSF